MSDSNNLHPMNIITKTQLTMKKIIFTLLITLVSVICLCQTSVQIYVVASNGTGAPDCEFGIVDTWSSQTGSGNMTLSNIDSIFGAPVYNYVISDTTYPIVVNFCLYVGATFAPFPPQIPNCGQFTILGPQWSHTIIADCGLLQIPSLEPQPAEISGIFNLMGQPIKWSQGELMIISYKGGVYKRLFVNQ